MLQLYFNDLVPGLNYSLSMALVVHNFTSIIKTYEVERVSSRRGRKDAVVFRALKRAYDQIADFRIKYYFGKEKKSLAEAT